MPNSLPAWVEETPDYVVRDGKMYICMGDMCLAMPIGVFLDGCELGKAAIVDWHRCQVGLSDNVVRLPGA